MDNFRLEFHVALHYLVTTGKLDQVGLAVVTQCDVAPPRPDGRARLHAMPSHAEPARLYLGMDGAIPYTAPSPASIGDHPGRNALIAIAADSTGQITGGQFIHLDRDGHKLAKAEAHARPGARRAGQCLGASLDRCRRWRLPPDDDDPRHLTETVDLRDDALLRDSKQGSEV